MSAYIIVQVDVKDPVRYEDYKRLVPASLAKYGGRFVVRGGRTETLEGTWSPKRFVMVEFPDVQRANSNLDGPRIRLVASGAVTAAAKILVPKTYSLTGKACADAYGKPKEQLDQDAARFPSKTARVSAAAAALTGLLTDR